MFIKTIFECPFYQSVSGVSKKKKAEIVSKEGQFFAASSISLMKKSTKYENPNSLYNIRARELKDLQTQLDSLNKKLIECLAK